MSGPNDEDSYIGKFQLFMGFVGLIGLLAVGFGFFGLFMVLTGGTDGGQAASVPEAFECDEFHGDPAVGHEAPGGISQNTTVRAMHSIDGTVGDGSFEVRFNVSDPAVLDASARQNDGTPVPVDVRGTTVVVEHDEFAPFRIWIDSADQGFITRSELDICPPTESS